MKTFIFLFKNLSKKLRFLLLVVFVFLSCNQRKSAILSQKDEAPPADYYKSDYIEREEKSKIKDDGVDPDVVHNTEDYNKINENKFLSAKTNPLSTFSVDVDRASYSNCRRFLNMSQLPPTDAIRIEEFVNYFDYSYKQPTDDLPFAVHLDLANCLWKDGRYLLRIAIKGKEVEVKNLPASNIVFLIDCSGSMSAENKLPLLQKSFEVLLEKLRPQDKVAIVAYAGAAGLVLPSTPCTDKEKISKALNSINSGGSTAGGEGILLAYKIAKENFIQNGNNRIILATDGDFNVGVSSDSELERLIEDKRKEGVFLTVLGFGMGNYKDNKMEILADKGNGNYAYIDNILEAQKILGKEIWGTIYTIAKDVKIQIEFNPSFVKAYRLIGYENRLLSKEDFDDDAKDAGDIGSGHTVTAFYEIIQASSNEKFNDSDNLEYQTSTTVKSENLMTFKLRYKTPNENTSKLIEKRVKESDLKKDVIDEDFKFAAAVAEFGMLLRKSEFKGNSTYDGVIALAKNSFSKDDDGTKADFLRLVKIAATLDKTTSSKEHE